MDYNKDYYAILGVDKKSSKEEIKSAYRKLALKWHPDRNAGNEEAKDKFQEINEAYEVLSSDDKRREYDEVRSGGGRRGIFGGMGGFSPFGGFESMANDPFFREMNHRGFQNFHSRRRERTPLRGKDIGINVELPFEDFFFGCKKTLDIKVNAKCGHCSSGLTGDSPEYEKCSVCGGNGVKVTVNGNMIMQETCQNCDGSGQVLKNKCPYCNGTSIAGTRIQTVEFEIPKGTRDSYSKTYSGVGHCGVYGGDSGDITIRAVMGNGGMFFNRGDNSIGTVHFVSIFKALGGGVETIFTPYGKKNVIIPSCMEDGHEIRFNGMGLKGSGGEIDGDLVVTFRYDMPKTLDRKTIDAVSKMAESTDGNESMFVNVSAERKCMDEYEKRLG